MAKVQSWCGDRERAIICAAMAPIYRLLATAADAAFTAAVIALGLGIFGVYVAMRYINRRWPL